MFAEEASTDAGDISIPARSRNKALEWNLVLLSQGIESTTLMDPSTGEWRITAPSDQLDFVRKTLQLYERENRAWPFRRELPWIGFNFDWSVLAWIGMLSVTFLLQMRPGSILESAGICNAGLVRAGEWWHLWTATTLHADIGHLAMNAVFGFLFLGIAMGRYGSGLALIAATVAGALANLVPTLWRESQASALGASGVVMAGLGLIAAGTAVEYWQRKHPPRFILEIIVGGLLMFILVGVSPTSDVPAHVGGFLFGSIIGVPLALIPLTKIHAARLNWTAGFAYCVMMSTAWITALWT